MRRNAFLLGLAGLAGCWQAHPPHTVATTDRTRAESPTLAREPQPPGRLIFDREGRAWEAACSGTQLSVRPWEGGAFQLAGPCTTRDGIHEYSGYDYYTEHVFLSARAGVIAKIGVISDDGRVVTIRERGTITRRIAAPDFVSIASVAFDGDAIILVVHRGNAQQPASIAGVSLERALAALVRIEPTRTTVRSLVDYMSTGPGFAPRLVVAGRDQLLLVGEAGGVRTCRYDLTCSEPVSRAPRMYRGLPLAGGGALLYDHEHHVSLVEPDGTVTWTTEGRVWAIFGATETEVWIAEIRDARWRYLDLVTLDRSTGERTGPSRGKLMRGRYERLGNYLVIAGIASTPSGPVVRGVFGGLLSSGNAQLVTKTLGAICWWENPHDGDSYDIPLDGACRTRYAKAIITERASFVATHPRSFQQRTIAPRH